MSKKIKILVAYHKPAPLLKDEIFVPIHLGRALSLANSKDGTMNHKEHQWMLDNMMGDDTGDNISHLNRKYCELTALYWAWKNYDKLENPDYFGLCHYRRIFELPSHNLNADVYVVTAWHSPDDAYHQYTNAHGNGLDIVMKLISQKYPDYKADLESYFKENDLRMFNMFIMKKELFFDYAKWLFKILEQIDKKLDYSYVTYQQLRIIGNIAERLQDMYIHRLKRQGYTVEELPFKELQEDDLLLEPNILPIFKDAPTVVSLTNDYYAPYTTVMLQSLIQNYPSTQPLEIYILNKKLTSEHQAQIKQLETDRIKINFIDIRYYLKNYDTQAFQEAGRFTETTYYRFFIPEIFKHFKKVLFLDPDMIIRKDITPLFNINLGNHLVAATRDVEAERLVSSDKELSQYFSKKLGIQNMHDYFQAGVVLFNVEKLNQFSFTKKCISLLKQIKNPLWCDQDIMNALLQGQILYIAGKWDYTFFLLLNNSETLNKLDYRVYDEMRKIEKDPSIIHFCGGIKPWNNPTIPFAYEFWKYARMTPAYEEILFQNELKPSESSPTILPYPLLKKRYIWYKILSKITFGKKKTHYKNKRRKIKKLLKQAKKQWKGLGI